MEEMSEMIDFYSTYAFFFGTWLLVVIVRDLKRKLFPAPKLKTPTRYKGGARSARL